MAIPTGLSDFHKVIITVLKSSFTRLNLLQGLQEILFTLFRADLALSLDRVNIDYDSFEYVFMKILNRHAMHQ